MSKKVDGVIINGVIYAPEYFPMIFGVNTPLPLLVWSPYQLPKPFAPAIALVSMMVNMESIKGQLFHLIGDMASTGVEEGVAGVFQGAPCCRKTSKGNPGNGGYEPGYGYNDTGFFAAC